MEIKCGGSDTTSAIASNMISGMIVGQVIDEGGTVLFHLKKPSSLKAVMAKWFYHKNRYIC